MKKIFRIFWILYYRIYFRLNKIKYGENLRICNSLYIKIPNAKCFNCGDNFTFSSGSGYNPLARNIKGSIEIEKNAIISIGNNVGISSACVWIFDFLEIHDRVKIGGDCIIMDSNAHSLNYYERSDMNTDRSNAKRMGIVIEEDVLIGTQCIILKGVKIGKKSIVGSGSVVTKSIPSNEIWAGNPAVFIKKINE